MKKRGLMLGFLPLLLVGGLTSCSNENHVGLNSIKGIIDANLAVEAYKDTDKITYQGYRQLNNDDRVQQVTRTGVRIYTNNNQIFFLNTIHNEIIKIINDSEEYKVKETPFATFFIINPESLGDCEIFDNLGNKLYIAKELFDNIDTFKEDDTIYVSVSDIVGEKIFFKYDKKQDYKLVETKYNGVHSKTPIYGVGERFLAGTKTDLKEYGKPGYYILVDETGKIFSLFTNSDRFKVSFYKPEVTGSFIIGTKMYWQDIHAVLEDEDYDVIIEGTPAVIKTKCLDAMTGRIETVKTRYYFTGSPRPIQNKDDEFVYTIVNARKIEKNKQLGEQKSLLFNDDLKALCDVTNLAIDQFIKTKHGYYNYESCLLYNNSFKVITKLPSEAQYLPGSDTFILSHDGKFGAVNSKGIIEVNFDFDAFYSTEDDQKIWARQDDMLALLDLKKDTVIETIADVNSVINMTDGYSDVSLLGVACKNEMMVFGGTEELLILNNNNSVTESKVYVNTNDVNAVTVGIKQVDGSFTSNYNYVFCLQEKTVTCTPNN